MRCSSGSSKGSSTAEGSRGGRECNREPTTGTAESSGVHDAQALRRQQAVELLTPFLYEALRPLLETFTVGAVTGRFRPGK